MNKDIVIPVFEDDEIISAIILEWHKKDGDPVKTDEELCEFEVNKVSYHLGAPLDGILKILVHQGETVPIGTKIGTIKTF